MEESSTQKMGLPPGAALSKGSANPLEGKLAAEEVWENRYKACPDVMELSDRQSTCQPFHEREL